MTPGDIVYNETYKRCKKAGVDELTAKNTAIMTLQKYKNNQFSTKVSKLIDQSVTEAKNLIVKKRRK